MEEAAATNKTEKLGNAGIEAGNQARHLECMRALSQRVSNSMLGLKQGKAEANQG